MTIRMSHRRQHPSGRLVQMIVTKQRLFFNAFVVICFVQTLVELCEYSLMDANSARDLALAPFDHAPKEQPIISKSVSDGITNAFSNGPEMRKALECLRKSKPDLPDLSYPEDALQHFHHIHDRLEKWVQKSNHEPHSAAKYRGPWIENRWITHFQNELEAKIISYPMYLGRTFLFSSRGQIYGSRIVILTQVTWHWQ